MDRINSLRRYCLLQAADAVTRLDMGLASTLWGRQEAEPGTPLPAATPAYAALVAAHYKCIEDLNGASIAEIQKLAQIAGTTIGARDAQAALTYLGLTEPADTDIVPAPLTRIT